MAPNRGSNNPVGRPRRSEAGAGETRDRILDRAQELLEGRGYAGMSMDDVARAAGLTKGTLYHHFGGGKDALIVAVAHRSLGRHRDGLAAAIAGARSTRAQLGAVAVWTLANSGHPEHILRDAARFLPPPHAGEIAQGFMDHVHAQVQAVLQAGIESGELAPHDTGFVTWAFLSLLAEFAALQPLFERPHLGEQIVDLVLGGVGSGMGRAAPGS